MDQEWAPEFTSVQRVADRLAPYGTWLPNSPAGDPGRIWVGTPLRAHRRCDRPMFDISNEIAYAGLMVNGTPRRAPFPGHNTWYDIRSADARGHWIPAEGEYLRDQAPNLLNVAVTRARRRLYVIGNRATWGDASYFSTLARHLPPQPPAARRPLFAE